MSVRKKPEKAVPVLLDRLRKSKSLAKRVLDVDVADEIPNPNHELSSKFDVIGSKLKRMTGSLSKIKNWEKKVADQLCAWEKDLDDEIVTFKDPEMESLVHDKDKLSLIKDVGELGELIWRDRNHELIPKLDGIESELKKMTDSLSKIKKWENKVGDQLCAWEQVLDDEIFTFKDDPLPHTRFEEDDVELKSSIPTVDHNPNPNHELSLNPKFDGIESKLKQMTDSLSKIKNRETEVVDQFRALEGALDENNIFAFKDYMESQVQEKLTLIEDGVKNLKSSIPTVDHSPDLNHNLISKFDGIESELKQLTDSLSKIKNWEKKVADQFCSLEQALDDEIFNFEDPEKDSEVHNKLTLIEEDVVKLKSLISMVDQSVTLKPEKVVPVLLGRLSKVKDHAQEVLAEDDQNDHNHELISKLDDFESKLKQMTDSLSNIKNWEKKVVDQFCVLEQDLDDYKLTLIKQDVIKLKSLLIPTVDDHESSSELDDGTESEQKQMTYSQNWAQLGVEDKMWRNDDLESALLSTFHCLHNSHIKMCLLSLSVFPENTLIKKRPLIYWWIGEGFVTKTDQNTTAEEAGEQVLQELLNEGFIKPTSTTTNNMNSFRVYPWIHRMLIQLAQKNNIMKFNPNGSTPCNGRRRAFLRRGDEGDAMNDDERVEDLLTVFNVDEQYLGTTSEWLGKLQRVEVLQMGRWQDSVTHHIEVEDYRELFKGLGSQKHLKYLSLRGIFGIETLPTSIKNLVSLQILDLKACHNLEKLPQEVTELMNLTHLDVSECYLLESMPKGLERLSKLQVLKGFVAGSRAKNSCKISDLARGLQALRKLSVRVRDLGNEQLGSLFNFSEALCILTISWGVVKVSNSPMSEMLEALPTALTKLDLRSVPFEAVPGWLQPEKLPGNLEKLYIRGGKLKLDNINRLDYSNVKVIRLKFLA